MHLTMIAVLIAAAGGALIGGWVATGAAQDRERELRQRQAEPSRRLHQENTALRAFVRAKLGYVPEQVTTPMGGLQ